MQKKILPIFIGLTILILSACASPATPLPTEIVPATETSSPTETAQPIPTDTSVPATNTAFPITDTAIPSTEAAAAGGVSFSKDIMPIFQTSCNECHGIERVKEGLDMTTYENLMAGSFNGEVIVPGNVNDSYLVELILNGKMPKRKPKLSDAEIQMIIDWINAGALNN